MFSVRLTTKKVTYILLAIAIVFLSQITLPILFDFQFNLRLLVTILGIICYFTLVDMEKTERLAQNAFLFIMIFGTVIAFVRPIQFALDEESHLKGTIGLSDSFIFRYENEEFPDYDAVFQYDVLRNQHYDNDGQWGDIEHEESSSSGDPVGFDNPAYLPGAIGWKIGRVLFDKIQVSYYLGRIGTVLAYAVLVFLAIRYSLVYKEVIYLFGTFPAGIFVTSGFHYDYLYYGSSLLFAAFLTNILSGKHQLTLKRLVVLQGLAFLLIFAKFPYVLMAVVPLLLPKEHVSSQRVKIVGSVNFLVMMIIALLYSGIINLFKVSSFVSSESPGLGYFLTKPLPIIRTLVSAPYVMVENFISRPLQYVSVESAFLISMSFILFLTMLIVVTLKTRVPLKPKFGLLFFGLLVSIALLIIYAITGDPRVYTKGDIAVGGIQGRYYFLPMAFLPLFLGNWLRQFLHISPSTFEEEARLRYLLQQVNTFLMIFTISVAAYTYL